MRLKKLTIQNFKGISNLEINFNGNTIILGRNAIGKTSILGAYLFLLTGKDSQNKTDFEILPISNPDVFATIQADFDTFSLKKEYYRKYTKQRGSSEKVFSGHSTDYYFNSILCKEKDYLQKISEFIKPELIMLLSLPLFFNTQKWELKRSTLFSVFGDLTDEEIISQNVKFSQLAGKIHTISERKVYLTSEKKKLNVLIDSLPIRIDEQEKSKFFDMPKLTKEQLQNNISTLKQTQLTLEKQAHNLQNSDDKIEIDKSIAETETLLKSEKNRIENDIKLNIAKLNTAIAEQNTKLANINAKLNKNDNNAFILSNRRKPLEESIAKFRDEFNRVQSDKFQMQNVCDKCGSELSEIHIQDCHTNFNKQKSEKLESINAQGKELKIELDEINRCIKILNQQRLDIECEKSREESILSTIKENLTVEKSRQLVSPKTDELNVILSNLKTKSSKTINSEKLAEINAHIKELQNEISELDRELSQSNGESTVQAFAWDIETNTKQTKEFQVPHIRYSKKNGNTKLEDPRDIYELVANNGARRLRACILGIIPKDITDMAVEECDKTLAAKADTSPAAIKKMLEKFAEIGVTKEMIEGRIQRKLDNIPPATLLNLRKIFNSIKDGISGVNDWFSAKEVIEQNANKGEVIDITEPKKESKKDIAEKAEKEALKTELRF